MADRITAVGIHDVARTFHGDMNSLRKITDYWGWVDGLYLAKNDDGIATRLLHGYAYEPQSRKLWRSLCADAQIAVDVGAHTGIYSLDACRSGAKQVLSIEPYYLNFARLMMNLRHANYNTNSTIFAAASDRNEIDRINIRGAHYYCSAGATIGPSKISNLRFPVYVMRLDSMLPEEDYASVKVVKIDTEHHGTRVLAGMPGILSYRPDLILECIDPGLDERLKPLGYHFYKINEENDKNFGLEAVSDLTPDHPFSFSTPNRYATVKEL